MRENRSPPKWLLEHELVSQLPASPMDAVYSAVDILHRQSFIGQPIQKDYRATWNLVLEKGRGYCADYSKLFTGVMLAIDIPVREWALGHENFGSGHTFNEVFVGGQWVFVDAFNGMLVRDRDSQRYLSVLEFRDRLAAGEKAELEVIKLTHPERFFQTSEEGLNYYARSTDYFYLIYGNNVFSYDANQWVSLAAKTSRAVERIVAILIGQYPELALVRTDTTGPAVREILLLRYVMIGVLILEIVLGLYLISLCYGKQRSTHRRRGDALN